MGFCGSSHKSFVKTFAAPPSLGGGERWRENLQKNPYHKNHRLASEIHCGSSHTLLSYEIILFRSKLEGVPTIFSLERKIRSNQRRFFFRVSGSKGAKRSRRERAGLREPEDTRLRAILRNEFSIPGFTSRGGTPAFLKFASNSPEKTDFQENVP